MKIEIKAVKSDMTPHQAERHHDYYEGFAKGIIETKRQCEGIWGWCDVVVTVTTKLGVGRDVLGQCNYYSEQDFIENSGYFLDMVKEATPKVHNHNSGKYGPSATQRETARKINEK